MSEENASTAPLMNDTVDPKGKKFPYVCSKAICRGWSIIDDFFFVDTVSYGLPSAPLRGSSPSLVTWPLETWRETSMTSNIAFTLARTICCLETPLVTSNWIPRSVLTFLGTRLSTRPSRTSRRSSTAWRMLSLYWLICRGYNCHSFVAQALNHMKYDGKTNWDKNNLLTLNFFHAKFCSFKDFLITFLPFILIIAAIIAIVVLCIVF